MNLLNLDMQETCRGFVFEHLPHEAAMFDQVWSAFWRSLDDDGIAGGEGRLQIAQDAEPIRVIGAAGVGGGELDTLFVLGSFVNTLISVHSRKGMDELSGEVIANALRDELLRIKAPDHLRPILFGNRSQIYFSIIGIIR